MNGRLVQRLRAAALGTVLALAAAAAQAHKASDAYLHWQVDGTRIAQRVDVALRDLDRDLELDTDGDGVLRWGEIRRRGAEIEALVERGVRITAAGRPCAAQAPQPLQIDEHGDGRYVVLRRTLQCGAPLQALEVEYRLFAGSDPTHRGLARVGGAAADRVVVLVPGAGVRTLDPVAEAQRAGRSLPGFVAEGVHHIGIGIDHVLFLVTLLMVTVWRREGAGWVPREGLAPALGEAFKLVSAFTLAHSLTLGLAALGVLAPPSRWVETLIAASVFVAALDNLRPVLPGPRWPVVALFGLVHGFGFAGALQELGLGGGDVALALLGFNLGVELGQLAVVAVLLPLACLWRARPIYRHAVVRGGSAAIAALALAWTLERGLDLSLLPW